MLKKFLIAFIVLLFANVPSVYAQTPTPIDTESPTASITNPVAGSTVSGVVTITVSASDNVGVARVEIYGEGYGLLVTDTTAPYEASWDTRTLQNGLRRVSAYVYDARNNSATPSHLVTVNNPVSTVTPAPTSQVSPTPGGVSCSSDFGQLSSAQLLQILPTADYYCTESIAQALVSLADDQTMQSLLSMINTHAQGLARRNAVRVIGRFAEQPSSSNARTLVVSTYANDVKNALFNRLQVDGEDNVLQDAIWVLDSFFYPYHPMQPSLETISKNTNYSSSLRFRAISAVARLIYVKTGIISDHDVTYVSESLQSNDLWVRAEAAFIFQVVKEEQLDASTRSRIISTLQTAYNTEQELTPKVYMAKALDRYNGNTALFDGLRNDYETTHLGNQTTGGNFVIRSGLPQSQLPAFLTKMQNTQAAFFQIMGSAFSTPLPTDNNTTMTLMLFATRNEYMDYMNSFIGYGGSAGGLYLQEVGKLYTYQRTPSESIYTVDELIQHELGHYLSHRYIFPGSFSTPGYFNEPKAWADEGTSEFYAGMIFNTEGSYATPLRQVNLNQICGKPFRSLSSLLAQTEGYNDPGVFDYANGWSFMYYLLIDRPQVAMNLYTAFRNNTYDLDNFATIAGVPSVATLQSDWHGAMQIWCNTSVVPSPTFTPIQPTATPTPTVTPTPIPQDALPPIVNITSPLNNAKVARNKKTTIKVTATDTSGIAKVEFFVNGSLKCTDTTFAYSCLWLVPSPRGVTYTLQAKAYDTKGNTAARSITVISQ